MRKINVGLIGSGFIHYVYCVPAFRSIHDANVEAASATTKHKVESLADPLGIKRQYYRDEACIRPVAFHRIAEKIACIADKTSFLPRFITTEDRDAAAST